jgi:phosphohistidine phosphatase
VDIYLIRHAEAVPLGEAGITEDASRPLTATGEEQVKTLATGFQRKGIHPAVVVSSPLLRARQTAEGLVRELSMPASELRINEDLAPGGKRRRLSRFLKDLGVDSVALVGHQPDLGEFTAWLVGSKKAEIDIAKAGVACVQSKAGPGRLRGSLVWLVTLQWLS